MTLYSILILTERLLDNELLNFHPQLVIHQR
jgi:hypothetical protein